MAVHDSPIHFDIRQTVDASFALHTNHKRPPSLHEDYHQEGQYAVRAVKPIDHQKTSSHFNIVDY